MKNSNFYKTNMLTSNNIFNLIKKYKTPLWLYNYDIIKNQIKKLKKFDIIRFAQKSCSNINILKIMKHHGVKVDAVSYGEIERAIISGFNPIQNDIIYTSDMIDKETLFKTIEYKIPINIGSIDMINQIGKVSPGHHVWLRINPKFGYGHHMKTNTGGENSKHGIWNPELALSLIKKNNLNLIGLHIHIGSGVNYKHLKKVCKSMVDYAFKLNYKIKSISAGGGISIPYKNNEKEVNIENYFNEWNKAKEKISNYFKSPITLEIEPGRFLVAQSGVLISKVYAVKKTKKKNFVIIDAGFNDLIRPALYGSYHKISVIHCKKNSQYNKKKFKNSIIAGPLCESGDIFTVNKEGILLGRKIPEVFQGDFIIIHDTGAYGSVMSSNYNSKPLIPEILYKDGLFKIIRRRQTIKEMISLEI